MFDSLKSYLKEKRIRKRIYDFHDEEEQKEETPKLKKVNIFDRIKFIKFNNSNKNPDVNMQKIKEVRFVGNGNDTYRNRIYKFFK